MFGQILSLVLFTSGFYYAQAKDVSLEWQYLDLGSGIGQKGVIVGDFDNNSYPEMIVVANSHRDIMVIQYDGQNFNVDKKLPRPQDDSGEELRIHSLVHMSTDGEYGIAVTEYDDTAFIYDLTTAEMVGSVNMTDSEDSYLVGKMELTSPGVGYAINDELVFVYGDEENGFQTKSYSGLSEGRAVYGSFTGENLRQLVYSDGSIFEYNNCTDTFKEIEGFPSALSTHNRLMTSLDIDNDGIDEIVVNAGVGLECVSAQDFGIIWTFEVDIYVDGLITGDYNTDGIVDVIYGDDQWGEIHALDSQTGEEIGRIDNPEHGVDGLSIGDYDGDGINEISWCGSAIWFIYDPITDVEEWRSPELDGPYNKYGFNTAGDNPGFFFASGGYGSTIKYYSLDNFTEVWSQSAGNYYYDRFDSIDVAGDLFNNGSAVIVVSVGGDVFYYNTKDGSQYPTSVSTDERIVLAKVANVFNKKQEDIIVYHTSINIITSNDYGAINVTSPDIGETFIDVAAANIVSGTHRDVFGVTQSSEMWRFNIDSGRLIQVAVEGKPTTIAALDNCVFGFTDAVFYGTDAGEVRSLTDSALNITVCPTGGVVHLTPLSKSSLTFVCEDSFGVLDAATGKVTMIHNLTEENMNQGELIGAKIQKRNLYLYGDQETVSLFAKE